MGQDSCSWLLAFKSLYPQIRDEGYVKGGYRIIPVDSNSIKRVVALMLEKYEHNIEGYNCSFLKKTIKKQMAKATVDTMSEYCGLLRDSGKEAELLLDALNVSYTDFFREPVTFALLEQYVFPKIISRIKPGGEMRIWSAGCSYGQEPYSIAMLLASRLDEGKKRFRFRVLATDISKKALNKGHQGVYSREALHNVKLGYIDKYFVKRGNVFAVGPELRERVEFFYYDLLDKTTAYPPESIYGGFDLVICRNTLIYYNSDSQALIMDKLGKALSPCGYLVTGEAERTYAALHTSLKPLTCSGAVFQIAHNSTEG